MATYPQEVANLTQHNQSILTQHEFNHGSYYWRDFGATTGYRPKCENLIRPDNTPVYAMGHSTDSKLSYLQNTLNNHAYEHNSTVIRTKGLARVLKLVTDTNHQNNLALDRNIKKVHATTDDIVEKVNTTLDNQKEILNTQRGLAATVKSLQNTIGIMEQLHTERMDHMEKETKRVSILSGDRDLEMEEDIYKLKENYKKLEHLPDKLHKVNEKVDDLEDEIFNNTVQAVADEQKSDGVQFTRIRDLIELLKPMPVGQTVTLVNVEQMAWYCAKTMADCELIEGTFVPASGYNDGGSNV